MSQSNHLSSAIIGRLAAVVVAASLLLAALTASRQDRRPCNYFGPPDVTCMP